MDRSTTETRKFDSRRYAVAVLVLVAVLWSLGGLFLKFIDWRPMAIAGSRSLVSAAVLFVALRGRPRFSWSAPQIGVALAAGLVVITFVVATKMTTAANAILLQYTAPVWVALFARPFLGERTSRGDWLTLGVVLGGIALFFVDQLAPGYVCGNFWALASGLVFAWLALFLRKARQGPTLGALMAGNLFAAAVGLPAIIAAWPPSLHSIALIVFLGVVQLGVPYILFSWASRQVTALDLMLIPTIEPILNPIWVLLFYGERPGPWALVGGVIVLAAITLRGIIVVAARPTNPVPSPI